MSVLEILVTVFVSGIFAGSIFFTCYMVDKKGRVSKIK